MQIEIKQTWTNQDEESFEEDLAIFIIQTAAKVKEYVV